jgi:hypothetical protein
MDFYDKIIKLIIENINDIELFYLRLLMDNFENVSLNNNELNTAILNKMETTPERFLKENIVIVLPLISNQSLFTNMKLIDRLINIFQDNLANMLVTEKLVTLLRIFTLLHSKLEDRQDKINHILNLIYDKLDINLIDKLSEALRINLVQSLIYLKSIDYEVEEHMTKIIDDKVMKSLKRSIITFFHRDILFNLTMLNYNYIVEDFTNMIPKDVAILLGNRKICIEVNGVSHFYRDKESKKFNDYFKKQTLINYGWECYEIDYFNWLKVPKENKQEYLNNLLHPKI